LQQKAAENHFTVSVCES